MSLSVKKARKKIADIRTRLFNFNYGTPEQQKKIRRKIKEVENAIARHRKSQGKFTHYDNRNRDAGYLNREASVAYRKLMKLWKDALPDNDRIEP